MFSGMQFSSGERGACMVSVWGVLRIGYSKITTSVRLDVVVPLGKRTRQHGEATTLLPRHHRQSAIFCNIEWANHATHVYDTSPSLTTHITTHT